MKNSSKSLIKEVHKDNILSSKKSIIKHHRSFQPLKVYDLVRIDIKSNNKDSTFTKYYNANWSKEIYMIESISKPSDTFSNPTYFINNTFQSRNKLQKINILNKQVEIYWNSPYKGWWKGIVGAVDKAQYGIYYEKYKPTELIWSNYDNTKWRFID